MPGKIYFEPETVQEIIKTYKNGFTLVQTGKIYNISPYLVRRLLLRNDIPANRYLGRKKIFSN